MTTPRTPDPRTTLAQVVRPGPLGRGPLALLARFGEPLYRHVVARRNRDFDRGLGVTRFDRPVISVGNISVGGTGKTPLVARIIHELRQHGRSPCIAMRGYAKPRSGGHRISDEAEEYARRFPGLPIVAQPDRTAGLQALFSSTTGREVDVVVLDDGFQHRRIARDLDIVLVDASAGSLEDRLLPRGWLREPVESLARAHAVVVTHAEAAAPGELERILDRVSGLNRGLLLSVCRHSWTGYQHNAERVGPDALRGRRVLAVCAIGNPRAFIAGIERVGAVVADAVTLRDHDPYKPATLAAILRRASGVDAVVLTEKDWTKLERRAVQWPSPVYRPVLEVSFERGWSELWRRIEHTAAKTPPILRVPAPTGTAAP